MSMNRRGDRNPARRGQSGRPGTGPARPAQGQISNRIHVARDGAEALDFIFCEGAHAGRHIEDGPKLILLDLKLPKVDGLEVLQRMKDDPRTKPIPVVVLTSSKEQSDMVESYKLGRQQLHRQAGQFRALCRGRSRAWLLLAAAEPAPGPQLERPAMPEPLNVLIVEDSAADAELVLRELRRAGYEPDLEPGGYRSGLPRTP